MRPLAPAAVGRAIVKAYSISNWGIQVTPHKAQ